MFALTNLLFTASAFKPGFLGPIADVVPDMLPIDGLKIPLIGDLIDGPEVEGMAFDEIKGILEDKFEELQMKITDTKDMITGKKGVQGLGVEGLGFEDIKMLFEDKIADIQSKITDKVDDKTGKVQGLGFEDIKMLIEDKLHELQSKVTDKFDEKTGKVQGLGFEDIKMMIEDKLHELQSKVTDKFDEKTGKVQGLKIPKFDDLKVLSHSEEGLVDEMAASLMGGDKEQFLIDIARFSREFNNEVKGAYLDLLDKAFAFQVDKFDFILQSDIYQFFADKTAMLPAPILQLKTEFVNKQLNMIDKLEGAILSFIDDVNTKVIDVINKKYDAAQEVCTAVKGAVKDDFNCRAVVRAYRRKALSYNRNNYDAITMTIELIFDKARFPYLLKETKLP